jgi:AcrR family transcriptional regulator
MPSLTRELPLIQSGPDNAAHADAAAPVAAKPVRKRKQTEARHEDKRTAILRTAAQLFAANGYESTSLDKIAEVLGMHKATLYHYVDNKESILYQCLIKSFGDLDAVMKQMEDRTIPALDRLRMFARSLALAQNNDYGRCLVLVGSRPLDMAPGGEIRKFQRRLDATVRALVVEGIADGSVKPCHPGLVSAMLFGSLNWVPRWFENGGKLTLEQVVDNFLDMLISGIATSHKT